MNLTISHILVPVDFSTHSELALAYASALAGRLGASLDVVHVVEDPLAVGAWNSEVVVPNLPEIRRELMKEADRRLDAYRTAADAAGIPMVATVRMGPAGSMITEYAKALGVDLIVMGTHGRSGLAHLFMGSVAERVVRNAPCPVLTLRDKALRDVPAAPAAAAAGD